jgi:hypothetical protein
MRKKKVIPFVFLLLLTSVVVVCFIPRSEPQVIGAVSPRDLAEIKRVIHREIWRGTLPDWSWNNIKYLPENIMDRLPEHVVRIEVGLGGSARATISMGKTKLTEVLRAPDYDVYLRKDANGWSTNGWKIRRTLDFDPVVLPAGRGF